MTREEKQQISGDLKVYANRYSSQNRAAASLELSPATLSAIVNGKWDLISDDMFRSLQRKIQHSRDWQIVETTAFQEIQAALRDSQEFQTVRWIVGDAGCGKTTAAGIYASENRDVYTVLCDEDMRKGDFVREIARQIGFRTAGMRLREILETAISKLSKMDTPLIIFDEGDKLNDNVFHYFINLYNRLEGKCGIVFMSTSYIEQRIERGVGSNRKGYNEIFSRIGRRFFNLEPISGIDVATVCRANGIADNRIISKILEATADTDFDLRCVKRAIHREKRVQEAE